MPCVGKGVGMGEKGSWKTTVTTQTAGVPNCSWNKRGSSFPNHISNQSRRRRSPLIKQSFAGRRGQWYWYIFPKRRIRLHAQVRLLSQVESGNLVGNELEYPSFLPVIFPELWNEWLLGSREQLEGCFRMFGNVSGLHGQKFSSGAGFHCHWMG